MTRFWWRVPTTTIAHACVAAMRPASWTDLGAGDGQNAVVITTVDSIQERRAVDCYAGRIPAPLVGWTVEGSDLWRWLASSPQATDGASLLDVIEHFDRPQAEMILRACERLFPRLVIVTPLGFMPHDGTIYPALTQTPRQWHRSGFTAEYFLTWGYEVCVWPRYHRAPDGHKYGAILAYRTPDATERRQIATAIRRAYRRGRIRSWRDTAWVRRNLA